MCKAFLDAAAMKSTVSGLFLHGHWETPRQAHFRNVTKERVVSRNTDVNLFPMEAWGRICQGALYMTKEDPSSQTQRGQSLV